MNATEFAALLAGAKYRNPVPKDKAALAKAHGLVIVHGASDDLMEFEGAICDEIGAYNGTTAKVDAKGLLPEREQIDDDDTLRDYFAREPHAKTIDAIWNDDGYSFVYRTTIPHATFEVTEEDGEPYCLGIVFSLAELEPQA